MIIGVRATGLKSFIVVTFSFLGTGVIFEVFQMVRIEEVAFYYFIISNSGRLLVAEYLFLKNKTGNRYYVKYNETDTNFTHN